MTDLRVRDAVPDDAPALAPLLTVLGYPTEPGVLRERLTGLLAEDRTARVLLAAVGDQVLGFITLHATPVLHRSTPVGRITALAVAPGHQGLGVGRRLVEAAEAHFASLGFRRIEVTSGTTHQRAYAFYRRLGYEDQGVRFARVLDIGSGAAVSS
jgi:ribosomal protein S18 acetylase RimI-like enzyme